MRGADALVRTLAAAGVTRIFTLSGNHVMPVFDAALDANVDLVHVRHEAAAVHMADAFARLGEVPGIAMVTGGPGHANAIGALYTALMAESPMVLISGHAPLAQLGAGAFQEMAQAEMAAPVTKASWVCESADRVASDVARAMRIAREGRMGPVHLSLPSDCLEGSARVAVGELRGASPMPLDAGDANAIMEMLLAAKRPLVLVGPMAMTRRGRERLAALEAASGIPVIGMESPRGIADPSLGRFAEVLRQADRILLAGKRLDFTLRFGKPPGIAATCELMQVDAETDELERTRRAVGERLHVAARADLFSALDGLERAGRERGAQRSGWRNEVADAIAHRPREWDSARARDAGRLHPAQALRPLQALLDAHPEAVFVSDGGEFGQWAQACLHAPHRVINGVAGSIGAGLPFAIGARFARPDAPVIAAMGDGTFGFHAAEIDTAVRHRAPFVAIVGNDARWNAEFQIQVREYGEARAVGTRLLPTRYDEVARAFGGFGELVTAAGEMLPAARRAMQSALPAVLNVMIEGLAAP